MSEHLLEVSDLRVTMQRRGLPIIPVDGVSLTLDRGEILGIAGESGSGKTLTLRSILGLLPRGGIAEGDLRFSSDGDWPAPFIPTEVHGHGISIIFQEPMTALNPTMRVGDLIAEGPRIHQGMSKANARTRAIELMGLVGIPSPERRARMWPHQLSGGLRQRVMIATALSTEPQLLLCDEPTTALDVSIQDQILGLLLELRGRLEMAIIFVSHDIAVLGELCDRLAIMYAGQIVEIGPADDVISEPEHPYTAALMASVPSFQGTSEELQGIPGHPPDPAEFTSGCRFAPRCPFARIDCMQTDYRLTATSDDRATSCIHPEVLTQP